MRNLFTVLDNSCTGRICVIELFWNSGVYWKLATSRRDLEGEQWSVSALRSRHPSATTSYMAGSCVCVPGAACTQLAGARVGQKGTCPINTRDLCCDCWLVLLSTDLLQRGGKPLFCTSPCCCKPLPNQLIWLPGEFREPASFSLTTSFSYSFLLGARH